MSLSNADADADGDVHNRISLPRHSNTIGSHSESLYFAQQTISRKEVEQQVHGGGGLTCV